MVVNNTSNSDGWIENGVISLPVLDLMMKRHVVSLKAPLILVEELTNAGSMRAAMFVRRNMVGKEPTQEELERWDLTPEVLGKLAEIDSEPTEDKEQQKEEQLKI